MKKIYTLFFTILCIAHVSFAQDIPSSDIKRDLETTNKDTIAWIHSGVVNMGFNEGLLHNWNAGGEIASLTINTRLSGNLTHLMKNKIWSNSLDMAYSLYYAYSNSFVPRKMDDRIDFTSKYGVHIDSSKGFYFTGLFNFKSQFTKGYDYTATNWDTFSTSKFLSPAYFTVALGLEYRKGANISYFLSPVAARLTLADQYYTRMNKDGAFGVEYNKTTRFQLGAYFSGTYKDNINKNTMFKTRLDLYADYLAKDQKDTAGVIIKKHSFGDVYIFSDSYLTWRVTKRVNIGIGATLIYDNSIPYNKYTTNKSGATVDKNEPAENLGWWQLKQLLTFGLEYKF